MKKTLQKCISIFILSLTFNTIISENNTTTITRGTIDYKNSTPLTITKPGIYKIAGNMNAVGTPVVNVTADNVELDLNGNTLNGGTTGIRITGNYITIKNGTIQNATDTGIALYNATGCKIDNCDIIGSATGIYLNNAHQNSFTNVRSLSPTAAGFSLVSSCTNYFELCYANNVTNNNDNTYGFISENGSYNILNKCYSSNISTTITSIINIPGLTTLSSGFMLHGNEKNSSLIECSANTVTCFAPNNSSAYGINLQQMQIGALTESVLVASSDTPTTVRSLAWAESLSTLPITPYLASSNPNNKKISVYEFSDSSLSQITTNTSPITSYSIAWRRKTFAPLGDDPNYLAAGDIATSQLKIFSFDGSSLDEIASTQPYEVIYTVDWAELSESTYIATGGSLGDITIFEFDPQTSSLTQIATNAGTGIVYALKWFTYNNTTYLASGGSLTSSPLKVFSFNGSSLTEVDTFIPSGDIQSIAWDGSSNLSIAYNFFTQNYLGIIAFNGSSLSETDNIITANTLYTIDWLSTSSIITGGAAGSAPNNNELTIFNFNGSTLSEVTSSTAPDGTVYSLGLTTSSVIATGGENSKQIHLFTFNDVDTITEIASTAEAGFPVYATSWLTYNGVSYLAKGGAISADTTSRIEVLSFNGTSLSSSATDNTPEGNIYSTAWLVDNGSMYLATGGDSSLGTNELNIFSFNGSTLSSVSASTAPDGTVYAIDWIRYNNTPYLAVGGEGTNKVKVFSFNGSTLTEVASSATADSTVHSVAWLLYNDTSYLAIGGEGSNEIRIFSFNGNSLTPVTASAAADGTVYSVAWTLYNGTTYLTAGGEGTNKISLFSFDGLTLTPITTSSDPDGIVNSIRWLFYNNTFYLATGGAATSGDNKISLFSFDGSSLSHVVNSSSPDGTVNSIDWLLLDNKPYLSSGGQGTDNQLQILEFSGTTTSLSPTNCTVKNCTAQNASATITGISDNDKPGTGIGIKADSTQNFITQNYAINNTTNYQSTEIDYITSQANTRGVYNIDGNLNTADSVNEISSKIDVVIPENWSIESNCDVIADKIELIPSQYPIEQGTVTRSSDSSKIISQSGSYFLRENIEGNIAISADEVTLDLNGFAIHNSTTGINITGNNVTVKNGIISTMSEVGIYAHDVTDCSIENCNIISTSTGILLNNVAKSQCINVHTRDQNFAGFSLVSSETNYFKDCRAQDIESTTSAYGFLSQNGSNNVFYQCQANNIKTTASNGIKLDLSGRVSKATAAGFFFNSGEQSSRLLACQVDSPASLLTGENDVFGIKLDSNVIGTYNTIADITSQEIGTLCEAVQWLHYEGKILLAVSSNSIVYIFELTDNAALTLITQTSFSVLTIYSIKWLVFNGKTYLAACGDSTLMIYEFNNNTLKPVTSLTGSYFASVAWLLFDDACYLSISKNSGYDPILLVYTFDGSNLTLTASEAVTFSGSCEQTAWIVKDSTPYLAATDYIGASQEVKVFEFTPTSTTLSLAATANPGQNALDVAWLSYKSKTYLAVCGGGSGFVSVYEFTNNTLNLIDNYTPVSYMRGNCWFIRDGIAYLVITGNQGATSNKVFLLSFDGSSLTLITSNSSIEGSEGTYASDIIARDRVFLAIGTYVAASYPELYIFEITGTTTLESAQNCTIMNCIAQGGTDTNASLFRENSSTGISANSSLNYVANNLCQNNGLGINYLNINASYIASQANTHGVDNIDTDRTEVDEFESKLDYIIANI